MFFEPAKRKFVKTVIMNNETYEKAEYAIRRWWLVLLTGLLSTAVGIIVLINPASSYFAFSLWLGIAIFVSGVMMLTVSLSSRNVIVRRGWIIAAGVIDIIVGIVLMFNIALSAAMLPVLLGAWILYRGVSMLAHGIDLRSYNVRDAGWVIFGAVLMIAISLCVLWRPQSFGVDIVVLFIGMAFIIFGLSEIALSYRLYDVHRRARELRAEH